MRSLSILIILIIAHIYTSFAQLSLSSAGQDTLTSNKSIRISILTCSPGNELYASFGHTGIRIIDSSRRLDEVYNYGTFNFSDPDFYSKFILGKLLYYLDKSSFNDFIYTYQIEKRSIKEQILDLSMEEQQDMIHFLENNLLPANRDYKYDFLFDNCATRVRDIFPDILGNSFYFGSIFEEKKISFRNIINRYMSQKHWVRFGMNLLLGSHVDSLMTDEASMFLPDFLYQGLVHAQHKGQHVVKEEINILKGDNIKTAIRLNGPLWMMIGLLILTVLSFLTRPFHYIKPIIRFLLLFITGVLGIFMLFMWLGTEHQACHNNYNILWAVPFNVIIAFMAHRKRYWFRMYALAAISLLIVALIIHVIGFQRMPLIELSPLFLCLMYVYIDLYRENLHAPLPVTASEKPV